MAKKVNSDPKPTLRSRKALTPEGRETQLISLAVNCAEEQLKNKTASSQVIVHFLKLGTEKEKLEREKLRQENELLKAKTESVKSIQSSEELYKEALEAFSSYRGGSS